MMFGESMLRVVLIITTLSHVYVGTGNPGSPELSIIKRIRSYPLDTRSAGLSVPAIAEDVILSNRRTSLNDCNKRFSTTYQRPSKVRWELPFDFLHAAIIVEEKSYKITCTGSLISENVILGAAYCASNTSVLYQAIFVATYRNIGPKEYIRKIVDIAVHPHFELDRHLNNIALLKLEKNVKVNVNVVPICLWANADLSAKSLYVPLFHVKDEKFSRIALQKVNSTKCPTNLSFASSDAKKQYAMCAEYENINKCSKIVHMGQLVTRLNHDGKIVPVVFGMLCNVGGLVSYIPIFKYRDWIITALKNYGTDFDSNVCIKRYKHLREDVYNHPDLSDEQDLKTEMAFNTFTVKLIWDDEMVTNRSSCYGAQVEPDAVITLAQCTSYMGSAPSKVMFYNFERIDIREIIIHPNYSRIAQPNYNNIAVIKLVTPVTFVPTVCGWYGKGVPSLPLGVKAVVTKSLAIKMNDTEMENISTTLITNLENNDQCLSALSKRYQLPQDSTDKYLCLQHRNNSKHRSYQIRLGAPVHNIKRIHNYVVGLNLFGQETDVDTPIIGVRLSTHKAWLESVLLPSTVKQNTELSFEAVTYIDHELQYSDQCRYSDGVGGVCTAVSNCSAIKLRLDTGKPITFCSNHTVVCCPEHTIRRAERDLELCPQFYRQLRLESHAKSLDDQSPHLVEVGWIYSNKKFIECIGYLITSRDIVTLASCINTRGPLPNVVRFGGLWPRNGTEATYTPIGKVEVHPNYNKTTQEYNIALITLTSAFVPNWITFPGCIWLNETHFPTQQKIWNNNERKFDDIYQMYYSDCETYLNRTVPISEACMFRKEWTCASYYNPTLKEASPKCIKKTIKYYAEKITLVGPLLSHHLDLNGRKIEYLTSVLDSTMEREYLQSLAGIIKAQRVLSVKDWIVSVLESN